MTTSAEEDFPEELTDTIKSFHASLADLEAGFEPLLSKTRTDLFESLPPLER
jgi:hypothetical protein